MVAFSIFMVFSIYHFVKNRCMASFIKPKKAGILYTVMVHLVPRVVVVHLPQIKESPSY
jgi:hypothetical protein